MPSPNEPHLVVLQCSLIWVVNYTAKGRVYQHPVVQMCPLVLRVRMKKDAVLDAGNDYPLVPQIDSDRVSDMNRLAVVVAHSMASTGEVEGPADVAGRTELERSSSVAPNAAGLAPRVRAPFRRPQDSDERRP